MPTFLLPSALALAATPAPDIKIEIVGLDPNDNSKVILRATNVGPSWSQNTSVKVEAIPPDAGAPVTLPVSDLNVPGTPDYNKNNPYYDEIDDVVYNLKAACKPGVKVRATLATAKAYDGTPETELANNTVESEPCPADGNTNANGAHPHTAGSAASQLLLPLWIPITLPDTSSTTPSVPEFASPGQHTLTLGVRTSTWIAKAKVYFDDFAGRGCGVHQKNAVLFRGDVGFADEELQDGFGTQCGADNFQIALDFDDSQLRQIPDAQIDNATLTYDESEPAWCPLLQGQDTPCWSSGGGHPENKPNGCVEIKLPTVDWVKNPPHDLLPYSTNPKPATNRVDPHTWDVTEPFSWQLNPLRNRPLLPAGAPDAPSGFGFLMTGAIPLNQLSGQDNTVCVSQVSNINLRVTYTVPPAGAFRLPN